MNFIIKSTIIGKCMIQILSFADRRNSRNLLKILVLLGSRLVKSSTMYCWVFQHQNCQTLRYVLFPCTETCQEWLSFHSSDNASLGNRSTELQSHGFTSASMGYWLTASLLCLRWSLPNILKHPGNPHDVGRGRVHIPSFGRIAR